MTEREALQRILLKLKEKATPLNRSGSTPWPSQAIDFLWELHGIAKQGLKHESWCVSLRYPVLSACDCKKGEMT